MNASGTDRWGKGGQWERKRRAPMGPGLFVLRGDLSSWEGGEGLLGDAFDGDLLEEVGDGVTWVFEVVHAEEGEGVADFDGVKCGEVAVVLEVVGEDGFAFLAGDAHGDVGSD